MNTLSKHTLSLPLCLLYCIIHIFVYAPIAGAETKPTLEPSEAANPQYRASANATSEQNVSYDHVYGMELELPFAGNVEVSAMDRADIRIKLEKSGGGVDATAAKMYLDAVTFAITQADDMLRLKPQLPEATDASATLIRMDCFIETPPDIALKIKIEKGDIRVKHIRGDINLTANIGNVQLSETMGEYQVKVKEGRIYGQILLTGRDNTFETESGAIDLVVLDEVAAAMDLTAVGGGITLRLPDNFPAEVELKTEKAEVRAITIELPVEIEKAFVGDVIHGWMNGGGPLIRLYASDRIAILRLPAASPSGEDKVETGDTSEEEAIPPPTVDVPQAIQPPVIDGDLFEKAWSKAVPLQSFYKENGIDPPDEPTQGFLMWDEKYLYIGLKAYDSQMRQIQISQTEWDSAVWLDDNLEILIQPSPETPVYYHLIINPIGAVFDQRVEADNPARDGDVPSHLAAEGLGGEVKWNSHARVKTQITPIFWSVEVAIPRDALEPDAARVSSGASGSAGASPSHSSSGASGSAGASPSHSSSGASGSAGASPSRWLFNLRRTVQRTHESSYWSPLDDSEQKETSEVRRVELVETSKTSEVWREQMGILHLVDSEASDAQIGESLTSVPELEERLEIAGIEVDGNAEIPTPEILQLLPFQRSDIISGHDLSWLNDALEDHSWFRDVRLETANVGIPASTEKQTEEDDKPFVSSQEPEQSGISPPFKVIVRIHVVELPTRIAETLELRGNERFCADVLRESFGLKPGRIALEELATKMQLIATLYKNHGYDLARADYQFVENNPAPFKLRIDIDEGHLDEIRFSGNHRIRDATLIKALDFKPGDVYYHALGELHIQQMRAKLRSKPYFKEIKKWGAKWEGDRRVLAIEIEERSPFNVEPQPLIDFNRVHGLILGGSGEVSTLQSGARTFGAFSIGLSSKIWNYQVGAENAWFERHQLSIGGSLYKRTDTTDDSGLSASEEFLAAALLGNAFLDYYQREGYQAWVEQRLTPSTGITLEFTNDDHENLFKSTDWSLFNKNDPKRSNLRINEGRLRTFALTYHFDSRDGKSYQKRNFRSFPTPNHLTTDGWRGYFSVEYAGSEAGLKGDFDFTRYRFEVVRYNRLSSRHGLDFRLRGGFSDTPLPRQRLFYLGGGGSLRGYDFKAFVGDNMLLFNMEYRFHFGPAIQPDKTRLTATLFLDTGYTWYDDEKVTLERLNTSIGMGLAFNGGVSTADTLKIEVARALRERHNISLTLRLARMF